ncbi:MAG: type II toxin-antitoxin system VapC family toxin [Proteobacteria bacterium]|nr:type II toxin-antitoxin system VapC family toxin [Pseudomonadota bacterium]
MILLDTNVVSEPLKPAPNPDVLAWLDAQPLETLYLSTIALAELRFGIAALPEGKRKERLAQSLARQILPLFDDRVLPFDAAATIAYAEIRGKALAAGKSLGMADACIAAIAAVHGLIVATRDTRPFLAAGLKVINPWDASGK